MLLLDSCLVAHMRPADGITLGSNREVHAFRLTLTGILNSSTRKPRTKWATNITSPYAKGEAEAASSKETSLLFQLEAGTQTVP